MPETCRVLWQNKFWIFDAPSWLFYTKYFIFSMTKSKHHYWIQNFIAFLSLWRHICIVPTTNSKPFFSPRASYKVWGFRRDVNEICTILRLDVARNGSSLSTFRDNRQPIFRDQAVRLSDLWRCWPIGCTKTLEKIKSFNSKPKILCFNWKKLITCRNVWPCCIITDQFESTALTTVKDPWLWHPLSAETCSRGFCASVMCIYFQRM